MIDLLTLRKTVLSEHDNLFGWEVISYEDVTSIIYFENDNDGNRIKEIVFDISEGYDVKVFEEAIRLRKMDS
jgi:hypothetical protein